MDGEKSQPYRLGGENMMAIVIVVVAASAYFAGLEEGKRGRA